MAPTPTTCIPTNPSLIDGSVSCTDTNNVGSVCTFTCNDGFRVNGKTTLTCTANGWSGAEPTCEGEISVSLKTPKSHYLAVFGKRKI